MSKKTCNFFYINEEILQNIIKACAERDIILDELFCRFYLELLILDPFWKRAICEGATHEFTEKFVNHYIHTNPLSLTTIKIQYYYFQNFTSNQINLLNNHEEDLKNCLTPLLENILTFNLEDTDKSLTQTLVKRIALYITLRAGLGNPKDSTVLKEAIFALRSIIAENDLNDFVKLGNEHKEMELLHYQHIVTGIRLFNRDCGKPSADIEDVPKLLTHSINAVQLKLQNGLLKIMEKVNLTTSAIDHVYRLEDHNVVGYSLQLNLPKDVTKQHLDDAVNFLILLRQHEVYVRKFLDEVGTFEERAMELFNELQTAFLMLHDAVKLKVAIQTTIVYPLFTQLSIVWQKIEDETITLSLYTNNIKKISKSIRSMYLDEEQLHNMIGDGKVFTDAMRLEKTMGCRIISINNQCEVLDPLRIKDFDKIPLQYLGFCAWSLVETNGGLIPGNPNMGICKWNKKYFVFSSPEAAFAFGIDPDSCVLRGVDIIRKKPELVHLLQIYSQLSIYRHQDIVYEKPQEVVMTSNAQVQTELHPIPIYIDKNYTWNMWDLYRHAIKMANLSNCLTHSMQTTKSNFRASLQTQTTELRDKMCQTKKDNYTNVPRPMNFVFGLRGRTDDNQHIVQLTRPVDK